MSKTFVLVHGSWHGGWAWDIKRLAKMERGGACAGSSGGPRRLVTRAVIAPRLSTRSPVGTATEQTTHKADLVRHDDAEAKAK